MEENVGEERSGLDLTGSGSSALGIVGNAVRALVVLLAVVLLGYGLFLSAESARKWVVGLFDTGGADTVGQVDREPVDACIGGNSEAGVDIEMRRGNGGKGSTTNIATNQCIPNIHENIRSLTITVTDPGYNTGILDPEPWVSCWFERYGEPITEPKVARGDGASVTCTHSED